MFEWTECIRENMNVRRERIPVEIERTLFKKAWQTQEATCPKKQIHEHTPGEEIHAR